MGAITSTNVATAIVKLVAADALPALMGNLVMGNLVNRDYEATLARAQSGDEAAHFQNGAFGKIARLA